MLLEFKWGFLLILGITTSVTTAISSMNYNQQHQLENQDQLENHDQLENQDQLENEDQQENRDLTPSQNSQCNQLGITETCNMFCKTDGPFGRDVKDAVYGPLTDIKESINNKFEEVENTLVNIRYDIKKLSPIDTTTLSGNNPQLEKLISDVLNVNNNVQTSVTTANKELNALKQDLSVINKLNLEESSNLNKIIDELASITNKVNVPSYTENTLLKSIENIINNKVNAMENNLKIHIDEKLKALENNQNKSMTEFVDNIISDKIATLAKEISDNKIAANKDNEILLSISNINNELKNISQNMGNINNAGPNVESATPSTKPTILETQPSCIGRTCNIQVPSSVKTGNNLWQNNQIPVEDELDRYMSSLTAISSMNYNQQHQLENQDQLENHDQLENQDQLENEDQQENRDLTPSQNSQCNQLGITETCNMFCKTDGPFGRDVKDAVYGPLTDIKESINNKFEEVENTLVNIRYDIKKLSPIDTTTLSGNNPQLEKLISDVLNVNNNVQTSVTTANKELNALKQDLSVINKLNLEESSNLNKIIDELASITNKVNVPSYTENTLLKSIENIINNKVNAMENNLKIHIDEKLKALENNQNKSMTEFVDNIISDKIATLAKEISDNKIAANKDNEILLSISNINNELKNISQNMGNINNAGPNVESATPSTKPTILETQPSCIGRTCNIQVPSSVKTGNNLWQNNQIPVEDELDRYMSSLTGCRYYGLQYERYFPISPIQVPFQGTFEWRGAVRARDAAYVGIWWPSSPGYGFTIGQDNNQNTVMYQWKPWTELTRQSSTGILLDDRYVPFCVKIQNGLLSIGKQCDDNHIISRNIAINIGEIIRVSLWPKSIYGAKYLSCWVDGNIRSGRFHRNRF